MFYNVVHKKNKYVLHYERGARKLFEFEVDRLDSASLVRLVFFLNGK